MNILSIGNSFSEDATRYLHEIAKSEGQEINTANLYIGGCSLEMHHKNTLSGARAYELQYNGQNTGFFVSLDEALENRKWDIVTVQQVSNLSFVVETYLPYAIQLVEYVRNQLPDAKIYLHQTWAYEANSNRLLNIAKYNTPEAMLADVIKANSKISEMISADGVIRSGELFGELTKKGYKRLYRDTFHASVGLGRYALGLLWYKTIAGKAIDEGADVELDEYIDDSTRIELVNLINSRL